MAKKYGLVGSYYVRSYADRLGPGVVIEQVGDMFLCESLDDSGGSMYATLEPVAQLEKHFIFTRSFAQAMTLISRSEKAAKLKLVAKKQRK